MTIVPAKCTQCGGVIEIDNSKEANICEYCGSAFITEKAIDYYNKYITTTSPEGQSISNRRNLENFTKMAEKAIELGDIKETLKYSDKILEIDSKSSKAWLFKMKAISFIGNLRDPKVTETIAYGKNAIDYSENPDKTIAEVYEYYIKRAQTLLIIAISNLNNIDPLVKSLFSRFRSLVESHIIKKDATIRCLYHGLVASALSLKQQIPGEYIVKHAEMQRDIVVLANLYLSFCEAEIDRLAFYDTRLSDKAINTRLSTLQSFKQGLPAKKAIEINDNRLAR